MLRPIAVFMAFIALLFISQTSASPTSTLSTLPSLPALATLPSLPTLANPKIVEMQWNITIFPGGPSTIMTGTIQDITAQLDKLNPNWKTDFDFDKASNASNASNAVQAAGSWYPDVKCARLGADQGAIEKGVKYLRGISGRPHLGPGPGECVRDSHKDQTLDAYAAIADGAQLLLNRCSRRLEWWFLGIHTSVDGTAYHSDGWNVNVYSVRC
ncbi:hypothetical protein EG327_001516 [Venturia inaequalis]|uniref:Uncharacterized protein n=1 Tax=Venturia inaequalis TaxID=5025 RepID=A0A8H3VP15_VENIN|nr:hypothetical protein EG327_001516 [Venturia inaequalis]